MLPILPASPHGWGLKSMAQRIRPIPNLRMMRSVMRICAIAVGAYFG
jgi:hypothetical protein